LPELMAAVPSFQLPLQPRPRFQSLMGHSNPAPGYAGSIRRRNRAHYQTS
jgi:hypothetical protein